MAKIKIDFILPSSIVGEATSGILLGEFNAWDFNKGIALKKQKDGSLKTSVSLDAGSKYEYRYLLNDGRWVNDGNADNYVHISQFQIENCVVVVPAEETKKAVAKKAPAKKVAAPKAAVAKKSVAKKAAAPKKAAATAADDLTKVEGVGKKIAELLKADGITTFELLGKSTVAKLKSILEAAGPRYSIHVPTTWPKQAKLAAAGAWDELNKLQGELKGGK